MVEDNIVLNDIENVFFCLFVADELIPAAVSTKGPSKKWTIMGWHFF